MFPSEIVECWITHFKAGLKHMMWLWSTQKIMQISSVLLLNSQSQRSIFCCRNANSEVSGNLKDLAAISCIPPNQRSVVMPYLIFSPVFILSVKLGSVCLWFSQICSCSLPFEPFAWEHDPDWFMYSQPAEYLPNIHFWHRTCRISQCTTKLRQVSLFTALAIIKTVCT